MRRFLLHSLFWFCYFPLYATISFLWDKGVLINWRIGYLLKVSVTASLFDVTPQIIFSYYLIYYGTANIVGRKGSLLINIIKIAAVFFLCIVLVRCLVNYIELPYIYKRPDLRMPIFQIERVLGAVVNIGFAFGLMFAIKSVIDQLDAKEREKNLIKEKLETELRFLKSQTNPHFLLNTLNNIYALARKKSEDTEEAVMRLSELLRFMLYESNCNQIQLTDEIKVLEDYLELETLRYNERLTIGFQKEIDNDGYKITPLLLLPFLENSFKHGISETRFESFINICIKVNNGWLNFEIENSKDSNANDTSVSNIGLANIKRQLQLTYSDYNFRVENKNDVFAVNLSINLSSYVKI